VLIHVKVTVQIKEKKTENWIS